MEIMQPLLCNKDNIFRNLRGLDKIGFLVEPAGYARLPSGRSPNRQSWFKGNEAPIVRNTPHVIVVENGNKTW